MIELKSLTKEFEEKGKSRASAHNGVFRAVDELFLTVEPGGNLRASGLQRRGQDYHAEDAGHYAQAHIRHGGCGWL